MNNTPPIPIKTPLSDRQGRVSHIWVGFFQSILGVLKTVEGLIGPKGDKGDKGDTGDTGTPDTILGTRNQVNVATAGKVITLSTPQDTDVGASPTFAGGRFTELSPDRLIYGDASKDLTSVSDLTAWVAGTADQITVTDDADGTVTLSTPQDIAITSSPTFAALTLTSPLTVPNGGVGIATLTDHGILLGSGAGAVTPLGVASNGQLPIGSAGADPVLAALTGTANQITITNGAGTITMSLPQDIHTAATPQFATLGLGIAPTTNLHIYEDAASTVPQVLIQQANAGGDAAYRVLHQDGATWSHGYDVSATAWVLADNIDLSTSPRIAVTTAGTRFYDNVAIGSAVNATQALRINESPSDKTWWDVYALVNHTLTGNGDYNARGLYFDVRTVYNNYNNAGSIIGFEGLALHASQGDVAELYGGAITYGATSAHVNTKVTGWTYGLWLRPYAATSSTTANLADIYIRAITGAGTVTNEWSIYNLHVAPSYFAGDVLIADTDRTTTGSLFVGGGKAIGFNNQIVSVPDLTGTRIGYINFSGYHFGNSEYRNLYIGNGRYAEIMLFTGSTRTARMQGGDFQMDSNTYGTVYGDAQDSSLRDDGSNMYLDTDLNNVGSRSLYIQNNGNNIARFDYTGQFVQIYGGLTVDTNEGIISTSHAQQMRYTEEVLVNVASLGTSNFDLSWYHETAMRAAGLLVVTAWLDDTGDTTDTRLFALMQRGDNATFVATPFSASIGPGSVTINSATNIVGDDDGIRISITNNTGGAEDIVCCAAFYGTKTN